MKIKKDVDVLSFKNGHKILLKHFAGDRLIKDQKPLKEGCPH